MAVFTKFRTSLFTNPRSFERGAEDTLGERTNGRAR